MTATGTAKNQIYVLAGAPTTPKGTPLFHTVVRVGTQAVQGMSATTAAAKLAISAAIVKAFTSLSIKGADNPVVLTYYGKWTVGVGGAAGSHTTATLLATGDGDCDAWSAFFMDVVKTQGVTLAASAGQSIIGNPAAPFAPATFPPAGRVVFLPAMLVKGWVLKKGATASNTYMPTTANLTASDLTKEQYLWMKANVTFDKSIPCQGNTVPLALFGFHTVVEISILDTTGKAATILFDPSYGTQSAGANPADRLLAWQNQSLDFVGVYYAQNPFGAVTLEVRMQAITAATTVLYVKYK